MKWKCFELEPMIKRDAETEKLPSVVYVMQPQSQMEEMGYNDLAYGWDMNHVVPTVDAPQRDSGWRNGFRCLHAGIFQMVDP